MILHGALVCFINCPEKESPPCTTEKNVHVRTQNQENKTVVYTWRSLSASSGGITVGLANLCLGFLEAKPQGGMNVWQASPRAVELGWKLLLGLGQMLLDMAGLNEPLGIW